MLALTRKKGEALVLNNNIEVTILEIRGDQVKIGVSAPKEVPIYRKEVYLQIQKENEESSNADNMELLKNMFDINIFTLFTDIKSNRSSGQARAFAGR